METMRRPLSAIGFLALFMTACAGPSQYVFESGSPEDMAARYIAEWGGQPAQYRAIFESDNCQRLADAPIGVPWDGPAASGGGRADLDTPEGREQTGYIHARRERLAQLGCSEEPPPLPPG
jgi:hypothetical protein